MFKSNRRLITFMVFCCIAAVISIVTFAAVNVNIKLSLSGMELVKNGSYTQAFLDVTIKNVNTNGIAFCLQYDSCLELSDAATGQPLKETADFADEYYGLEYFKQNTDNFPMIPRDTFLTEDGFKGNSDLSKKYLFMYFMPLVRENESPMNPSDHVFIKTIDGEPYGVIHADNPRGLNIGQISFTVSDLDALADKTPDELKQLIKIVPFDTLNMGGLFPIEEQDTGVYISYYDENDNDQQKFYSEGETEIKLSTKIYDISADVKEAEISALDIYNTGTQQDLIDYINSHMSDITIKYTDESAISDRFIWNPDDPTFECSAEWEKKGGEYTVRQKKGSFTIEVHVKVLPVTIDRLYTDNEEITYAADSATFPASLSDLSLPEKVHVVLSPSSTTKGLEDLPVEFTLFNGSSLGADLPDAFKDKTPGSYTFTVSIGDVDFNQIAPWLTPSSDRTADVKRNIVADSSELPKKLVAEAQTTDDGHLIINIHYEDNSVIDPNTDFTIRMQDGSLLDISKMGSNYDVSFNAGSTEATITISPDINDTYQKEIAKKINLGSRIGEYAVSAKEPGKYSSEFIKFSSDSRLNKYTESKTFDFSGLDALTFPIASDGKPSKTITLPGTSTVETTYSGYNGSEPGGLKTVIVDSWSDPVDNGDETFTVVGTMLETVYTNYGMVKNPDNHTITITYKVSTDISAADESIADIEDFRFDTKQVGYDYNELQLVEFIIENTGTVDIKGLSVKIESQDGDEECFTLVNAPPTILGINQTAVFTIRNLKGLEIKDHVSKVTISSNNNEELDTFFIRFNVIESEAFKISLKPNNKDFGSTKTQSGLYTSAYGDPVTIIATPVDECKFVRWEAKQADGTDFPLANTATVSFNMPDSDLTITAVFEEMEVANLRLSDLKVKNPDLSDNQLCDKDWKPIQFDPVKREYFVVEPTDTETNSLWFTLRDEGKDCEVTVTHTKGSVTDSVDYNIVDDVYKTDLFMLADGPTDNILTITMAKKNSEGQVLSDDNGNLLEKSYKIHIRKLLTEDQMATFRYGNSPYGLIMDDDSIIDKNKAKEEFIKNKNRFAEGYIPSGGNAEIRYTTEAWQYSNNYDRCNTALFVIGKEEFSDPGWDKLTNSIGDPVALGDVQRSLINIKTMIMNNNWGTEEDFSNAQMDELDPILIANRTDGQTYVTINELNTLRVRPDIYSIEYKFTDYNGKPKMLYRPLIVLPSLGDIDINGATERSDALRITNRFENIIPYQITQENRDDNYEKGKTLYRYRVCDVNKDRNVNSIDENTINSNQVKQFYTNKKVVSADD